MPYFERKPWTPPVRDAQHNVDVQDVDMVHVAKSILMAEAEQKHAIEGPFRARRAVSPGDSSYLVLRIENSFGDTPETLHLSATELRTTSGASLPETAISLSPQQVTIAPGQAVSVKATLHAPKTAKPGVYSGRIKAAGTETTDFVVEFEVSGAH